MEENFVGKNKYLCVQIRFLGRLRRRCSGRGSRMLCIWARALYFPSTQWNIQDTRNRRMAAGDSEGTKTEVNKKNASRKFILWSSKTHKMNNKRKRKQIHTS